VTEGTETSTTQPPADAPTGVSDAVPVQARAAALADERPEVAIGAAFAGGLVLAMILKRLAR
jgi:hypothetical protein